MYSAIWEWGMMGKKMGNEWGINGESESPSSIEFPPRLWMGSRLYHMGNDRGKWGSPPQSFPISITPAEDSSLDDRVEAASAVRLLSEGLTARQFDVLLRLKLLGMTQSEVATLYGVSTARIAQIEGTALRKAKFLLSRKLSRTV